MMDFENNEIVQKAAQKCMKLLEYSDRTEYEIRKRLKEGGFPPFAIDKAVSYVKQYHYLDDERFARNYIYSQSEKKSLKRIAEELNRKGISRDCIENLTENCREEEEKTAARILEKYVRGKDLRDEKVRWNSLRYMTGKGFSYDLSRKLIEKFFSKWCTASPDC